MEAANFKPRIKNSSNDYCVVSGCKSKAGASLNVSFHRFPKPNKYPVSKENIFGNSEKIDKLQAWKNVLKVNNCNVFNNKAKVCSLHFKKSDYLLPDIEAKRRILKKNAIPSVNLPGKKMNEKVIQGRLERKVKRSCNKLDNVKKTTEQAQKENISEQGEMVNNTYGEENEKHKNSAEQITLSAECIDNILVQAASQEPLIEDAEGQEKDNEVQNKIYEHANDTHENSAKKSLSAECTVNTFIKAGSSEPSIKDAEVQVNTSCFLPSFVNSITSNSELSTATGIESFDILNTIVEIVRTVSEDKYEKLNIVMNTRNRVLMTYVKLKQNLSYSFLAILFHTYSAKHCQRVFYDTIEILSKCLSVAIPWPSREEISKNLPKCFKGFEDVRVVLDCTEIFIQTPSNLCCQVLTYSHYKGSTTCKIMTGVSPAGNITYISKVYGGRATDSVIFQQSNITQLLEPGDGVMVDHGFLIDEICELNSWKCIRPPFLKEKKQFSKEESLLTSKIATARVHIERSNQRIKTFKIIGSVMPVTLVPIIENIFTVICATINMSSPILSDSKFMTVEE